MSFSGIHLAQLCGGYCPVMGLSWGSRPPSIFIINRHEESDSTLRRGGKKDETLVSFAVICSSSYRETSTPTGRSSKCGTSVESYK